MFELYHNNYITSCGSGHNWKTEIGSCSRTALSFKDECINSAKLIKNSTNKKLKILVSGGKDSLFVVNSFLHANVSFDVVIMSWGDLNSHDTTHAYNFCLKNNITPITINFDIIKFIESGELLEFSKRSNSWAYQISPILKIIENLDGVPVICGGDPMFVKVGNWSWAFFDLEVLHVYSKWFEKNSIEGIPEFFKYTPEQFYSYTQEQKIKDVVFFDKNIEDRNTRSIKYEIYKSYYNDNEDYKKYDGWENIKNGKYQSLFKNMIKEIEPIKQYHNGEYLLSYNLLCQKLIQNL